MSTFTKYTDIKSLQDACKHQGIDHDKIVADLQGLLSYPEDLRGNMIGNALMLIVAKSINQLDNNYVPNWNDHNEWKYWPWFKIQASNQIPSGFGFSDTSYASTYARAYCGSRLCFRTSEIALYVAKTFIEIYKQIILIQG